MEPIEAGVRPCGRPLPPWPPAWPALSVHRGAEGEADMGGGGCGFGLVWCGVGFCENYL